MLHQLTYHFTDQLGAFVKGQRFWITANRPLESSVLTDSIAAEAKQGN